MKLAKKDMSNVEQRLKSFGLKTEVIERETAFALQTINGSKKLLECDKTSILSAIVQSANIGLSLNPAKQEAALIPRKTQGGYECSLMPMYRGIANLAYSAGNIAQISTIEVCEKDEIRFTPYDNENPVQHSYGFGDRGKPVGYYTLITYSDGRKQVESMTLDEVLKIRNGSDGYSYAKKYNRHEDHPWHKWFSEMARKTCLKRALKHANTVGADDKLSEVISIDNADYKPSINKIGYIERLINNSTFDDEYKAALEEELAFCNSQRADEMIQELSTHQLPNHPAYSDDGRKKTIGEQVKAQVENEKS
jgi:phage RecT family recombinase